MRVLNTRRQWAYAGLVVLLWGGGACGDEVSGADFESLNHAESGAGGQGEGLTSPLTCPSDVPDESAFAVRVVSFEPGEGAGFGQRSMPDVVLGAPRGVGDANGGFHVASLGVNGEIVLELGAYAIDCGGPDLVIFENAFALGEQTYVELAEVSVSVNGEEWFTFPCDPTSPWPHEGCAGVSAVYSNEDDADSPQARAPGVSGGDAFDLADVGLRRARFVRIRDLNVVNGPSSPPSMGFDLDAVAISSGHAEPF